MKKYVDAATEQEKVPKELQALFSLQSLVTRLEHPNKLLHSIFDVLWALNLMWSLSCLSFNSVLKIFNLGLITPHLTVSIGQRAKPSMSSLRSIVCAAFTIVLLDV